MRELVCDEVNRSLARQEVLLGGLLERLGRAAALMTADSGKLAGIKQLLSRDLKDKVRVVAGAQLYDGRGVSCVLEVAAAVAIELLWWLPRQR
jgi:hypothetical protein